MPRHIDVLRHARNASDKPPNQSHAESTTEVSGQDERASMEDLAFPSEDSAGTGTPADLSATKGLDAFAAEEPEKPATAINQGLDDLSREPRTQTKLPHSLEELASEQAGKTAEEVMQEFAARKLDEIPAEQAERAVGDSLGRQLPETLHELAPQEDHATIENAVIKLLPRALQDFTERQTEKALEDVVQKILRGALKELTATAPGEREAAAAPQAAAAEPGQAKMPPHEETVAAPKAPPVADLRAWIEQLARLALTAFQAAAAGKPQDISALAGHVRVLAAARHDSSLIDALELHLATSREHIVRADTELGDLVIKGMTVMLYGLKLADRLQLSVQETASLMLAGLLHHIGLAMLPAELRQKKGDLSAKEQQLLQAAPKHGEAFLRQCRLADTDALAAIRYWRERFDGSGPEGMKGKAIPVMARMIGLLTAFEALIHFRPYRKRLLPMEAVSLMIKQSQKEFDPELLKDLIESLSLYPVGSYVQLNSGDIGLVLTVNPKLPLRPRVRLILDRLGLEIEPREVDLVEQPNLIVRRCVYEEELEDLKARAQE